MTQPTLLNFRPPSSTTSSQQQPHPFTPPSTTFISGTWHIQQSSLPMWKSKRNVSITYTPISSLNTPPHSSNTAPPTFDNVVKSQSLTSSKTSTIKGIEKPDPLIPAAWNWRGKGLLKVASSHWEILGYGDEDGGWMVIYFEKTLFTPAGVDFLTRKEGGVGKGVVEGVMGRLRVVGDGDGDGGLRGCVEGMFEVRRDDGGGGLD